MPIHAGHPARIERNLSAVVVQVRERVRSNVIRDLASREFSFYFASILETSCEVFKIEYFVRWEPAETG